jgi:hypothetical protein
MLDDIPDHSLGESIKEAAKNSKFFPKPAHILEAWKTVKMTIPDEQDEKPTQRPSYLTAAEKKKLHEVYKKYPGFQKYLDSLDIENDPNGTNYPMPVITL